jgi:4'-phosphopantetheinyl transferase
MARHIPQFDTGDVHVWLARTGDLATRTVRTLAGVMTADERERLSRFAAELHRRQYAIGRGLLRLLIGAYLKCEPQFLRFAYGPTGKPRLAGETPDRLYFNVAHSGEVVALAFAKGADVGIDVERIVVTPDWLDVARQTCTRRELDDVAQQPPATRPQRFFSIWTRREAFVKATGQGISALTRDLEIPSISDGWRVEPVDAGPGYAAAVAVHAPCINMSHFTWTGDSHDAGFREHTLADGANRL